MKALDTYGGRALRIAVGITVLAILLLAGEASAATPISSCTTVSSPGTYELTQNIINSTANACIYITSSNVVFDGKGYMIDGIDGLDTRGVLVYGSNVTVKNLIVKGWDNGIYYYNAVGGNITNNIANTNVEAGIRLTNSRNNVLTNNTANMNTLFGIYFYSANNNYNTLINNNASLNGQNGIRFEPSNNYNTLTNNTVISNNESGIYLHSSRNNTFTNNYASQNRYEGIRLENSSNNTIINNIANSNDEGIYLEYSGNNTITNNTANSNSDDGLDIRFSSNSNTLSNNNASNNSDDGIYLNSSKYNILRGNNANSNIVKGISLHYSNFNSLIENKALNNAIGIEMWHSGDNMVYNNHFNNINNFGISDVNNWNTTKTLGTNIIGGSYIGGNFWANPGGTGYSQTCTDGNNDGICDSPYTLDSNNTDYLPLAYIASTPTPTPVTGQAESEVHVHKVNKLYLNNLSLNHNQLYNFDTLWTPNVWEVKNLSYVIYKISTPLNFTKVENYEEYQNGSEVSSNIPYTHTGNDYIWNLSLVDRIGSNIDLYTNETNHTNPWADLAINKTQEGNNTRLNITFIPAISLGYNILTIRADQILSYTYPSSVFSAVPGLHRIFFSSDTTNQNQAYNFSVLVNNPEEVNLWLDNTFDWVVDQPSNAISLPVSELGSINVNSSVPVKWSHRPVQPQYVQDIYINMSASTPTPTPTANVSISGFSFQPQTINVTAGTTVTWTNLDSVLHTVTSDTGLFDSGSLSTGQTFSRTFNAAGNYDYHCSIHPSMTGRVAVSAPALSLTITASRANLAGAVVPTTNITTNLNTSVTFTVTDGTSPVSGAAVTVTQGGSTLGTNTTNAAGQAAIIVKAPTNATVTATASKAGNANGTKVLAAKGDVNGDGSVDIVDALFIAQSTVGLKTVDTKIADVTGDGSADIVDALFIAQYTVGLKADPTTP